MLDRDEPFSIFAKPGRSWPGWLRFSLRTLLILVLLAGSAGGLWWQWAPWDLERSFCSHEDIAYGVRFSPDGERIVTGGEDGKVRVWLVKSGANELTIDCNAGSVFAAEFSPDGKQILTGHRDGTVRLWELSKEVSTLRAHTSWVRAASFSRSGREILTAGNDKTVKVWDREGGTARLTIKGFDGGPVCARFSPDDKYIAAGDLYGQGKLWWASDGKTCGELRGHTKRVTSIEFSPDSNQVVSSSYDATARIWNRQTASQEHLLLHPDSVFSACFSTDGTQVFTACRDGIVRIWNAMTGKEMGKLLHREGSAVCVSMSADGRRLAVTQGTGVLNIWHRRRPEYWWGIAWLPEFWLTAFFAVALIWSVWRDRYKLNRNLSFR